MKKFLFLFLLLTLPFSVWSLPSKRAIQKINHQSDYKKVHPIIINDEEKFLIVLDAGHGGRADGAKIQSFKEKKITLSTALMTKKYLEEMGYPVILTRNRDIPLSLAKRAAIANRNNASIFVSIHFNACPNAEAQGIEVFYYGRGKEDWRVRASKKLAREVLLYLIDQTQAVSRGVKNGDHHVTRETRMPAILVEGGFITNKQECTLLRDRSYLDRIAKGIAKGIDKYLKS